MYNSIKEKALKEIYGNYTIHLEVQSAAAWNLFLKEISCDTGKTSLIILLNTYAF